MINFEDKAMRRWWLPLATLLGFVLALLLLVPFAAGYEHSKLPLGVLLWKVCLAGQSSRTTLDFSYCLFVPVIVAYLIFLRKDQIAAQPIQGVNGGLGLVIAGLFLFCLGFRAEQQLFGYAAMQIMLAGMVLWLWGWPVFRQVLFAWAFFAFFWPLPFLDSTVAFPLRKFMTSLAFGTLNIIGVPTIQSGTALMSAANPLAGLQMGERFRIDIADPCSGIRSLFALMMISALYAYLTLPKLWQQWIVFLASIPLTVIGNLARVLILIAGSIAFGSNFAIGTYEEPSTFHEGAGFMVYGVALGLELALGTALVWLSKPRLAPARKAPAAARAHPRK